MNEKSKIKCESFLAYISKLVGTSLCMKPSLSSLNGPERSSQPQTKARYQNILSASVGHINKDMLTFSELLDGKRK